MGGIDLKDAYYSVKISEEDSKYLKFYAGKNFLRFVVLPNGMSSDPRKFTKLTKLPNACLRIEGVIEGVIVTIKTTLREQILAVRSIRQIRNSLAEFILTDREKNLIWRELILADREKVYIWRELILADSPNNFFLIKGFDRKKKQSTLNGKKKTPM